MHQLSLFIFRRDLRLQDNMALFAALKESEKIIPCFIFDPQQVGKDNDYKSDNSIQFMIESLQDLEDQLLKQDGKLFIFYGDSSEIIEKIIKKERINAIYCNADYTPFAKKRDLHIEQICKKYDVIFKTYDDALINPPNKVLKKDNTPYSVFTAYYKTALKIPVSNPIKITSKKWYPGPISYAQKKAIYKKVCPAKNPNIYVNGGRKRGLAILKSLKHFKDYAQHRDFPSIQHSTTALSAHHKFGTISIRESYHAIESELGASHPLLRQLYWRDFYTMIAYHHPEVFGAEFVEKYRNLSWKHNHALFNMWCEGQTGFPIVDAGMRQLNSTGYMHNRVRMIVASFLTKDLHIDWRWGEKYFAQKLIDYDPAVNNGNWQWSASTGCDAQPYFRIFNPWLQQKKFDPDCIYIKQWIPELKKIDPKIIHQWERPTSPRILDYPRPMVDHSKESKLSIAWFKKIR